jgi:hypothetical protein
VNFHLSDSDFFVALGITDEVEKLGLKGNKKKKSRKLDEDFMVTVSPSCVLALYSCAFLAHP